MTIVNEDSSVISKWSSKLIDDARVVIYNRNMFIIQATARDFWPASHSIHLSVSQLFQLIFCLTHKYWIRLERFSTSLLQTFLNYGLKNYNNIRSDVNVVKTFFLGGRGLGGDKLDCSFQIFKKAEVAFKIKTLQLIFPLRQFVKGIIFCFFLSRNVHPENWTTDKD